MKWIASVACAWGISWAVNQTAWIDSLQGLTDAVAPKARLGLSIRNAKNDSILVALHDSDWFVPASTLKILVTATAIDTLPLNWTPKTTLKLEGGQSRQTFVGKIRVIGGGDPNISGRYLPDAMALPWSMADSLKALGIDTIRGLLEVDSSFYSGPRRPHGWARRYFNSWYGAEVSALSFNDNCFRLVVQPSEEGDSLKITLSPDVGFVKVVNHANLKRGKRNRLRYSLDDKQNQVTLSGSLGKKSRGQAFVLPIRNPSRYFLAALQKAFQDRGVTYIQDDGVKPSLSMASLEFTTAPLLSILDEINQRSQNLHAEMLLRNLGALYYKEGTTEAGIKMETHFLHKMGLNPTNFFLIDGCGLSPDNRVKPASMSLLLSRMHRHSRGALYQQSLGVPGISGSSVKRLRYLEQAHRNRVKTGYINGVQGLVGYVASQLGDTLSVALYLNGYQVWDQKARNLMDSLWSRIARHYDQESLSLTRAKELYEQGDSLQNMHKRLDYFSKALIGTPYLLGPTGEGLTVSLETKPRIQFFAFDCVTYLEHVMALALVPPHAENAEEKIYKTLQQIRYQDGMISYQNRKHYFIEDWIGKSAELVRNLRVPGDTLVVRTMDKKKFFAQHDLQWNHPNPQTSMAFLPFAKAIEWAEEWNGDDTVLGVGFMAKVDFIGVTHTGFLIARHGEPIYLRHASSKAGEVREELLKDYLLSRKGKTPGIYLYEFLEYSKPEFK